VCPFILFIVPRFVSLGMEQVFWFSDDDLQDWQREVLDREFKNNEYGHFRYGCFPTHSEGTVEKDLPQQDAEKSLGC